MHVSYPSLVTDQSPHGIICMIETLMHKVHFFSREPRGFDVILANNCGKLSFHFLLQSDYGDETVLHLFLDFIMASSRSTPHLFVISGTKLFGHSCRLTSPQQRIRF